MRTVAIARRCLFRYFLLFFLVTFLTLMIVGYHVFSADAGSDVFINEPAEILEVDAPILLWWTASFSQEGAKKNCGKDTCFITSGRKYKDRSNTKVFLFYGTDFNPVDLPLPRNANQEWALLHEESPKNNYYFSHADVMTLFNHTCTFRRESDYPVPTQHLPSIKWLESTEYLLPTTHKNLFQMDEDLAPILYVHSDCQVPSQRDEYMKLVQQHMKVDSYGLCEHNKDLPKHLRDPIKGMSHVDFYNLIAKYKFSFAMENGICNDYMTEKLWRPLMVGSVPIILGSPKVKDFLPANNSAIVINDFKTAADLAEHLLFLNSNDDEYEKYLHWKQTGVTNQYLIKQLSEREWSTTDGEYGDPDHLNFIEGFECFVCQRVHEDARLKSQGKSTLRHQATVDHYGCPAPIMLNGNGLRKGDGKWIDEWLMKRNLAKSLRYFINNHKNFSEEELYVRARSEMY